MLHLGVEWKLFFEQIGVYLVSNFTDGVCHAHPMEALITRMSPASSSITHNILEAVNCDSVFLFIKDQASTSVCRTSMC